MQKSDLPDLIEQALRLAENLHEDSTRGVTIYNAAWHTYFQILGSITDSIRSTLELLRSTRYKDCFVMLRSVFEYSFLLLLMMKGTQYRQTRDYTVPQGSFESKKEARDKMYENWVKDKEKMSSPYARIIGINKGSEDDVIHVTLELKGLYDKQDVEKKGETFPMYYFIFEEYDPDIRTLSNLKSVYRRGSSFDRIIKIHRDMYTDFLFLDSIEKNMKLNNFLTEEQMDRFKVHYNFLSSFTHPTRRAIRETDLDRGSWSNSNKREALERLVLCYIAHFGAMLIRCFTEYFHEKNPSANLSRYVQQAQNLESAARDFWFIYNDPLPVDLITSKMKKEWMKMQKVAPPNSVVYDTDPLRRMEYLVSIKRSNNSDMA